jgi:CRP-like cAMP-binding protein
MEIIKNYIIEQGIHLSNDCKNALSQFSIKKMKKGDFLIKEGKVASQIGFIVSGKIMHYYNIDGKEITRWVSIQNNFVTALISFINSSKSLENLICIEDVEIILYDKHYFQNTLMLFKEIELLWKQTLENNIIGYEHRVYQLITTKAEKRYLNFRKTYPWFEKEIPQKYIASMLGIEPRHLSRIRKKLSSS